MPNVLVFCTVLISVCLCHVFAQTNGNALSVQVADRDQAFAQLATDAVEFERLSRVMRTAAELALPSVVHIETKVTRQRIPNFAASQLPPSASSSDTGRRTVRQTEETGAGIIVQIGNEPFVVTNRHVVAAAEPDSVSLMLHDHQRITAKQILMNADFDLAVIKISETKETGVIPAKLGNSDAVQLADHVLVIGSPFGLSRSVTDGIISATGRRNIPKGNQPVPLFDLLQTDAAINPGNSGGPLVNLRGEVIGMISAIASSSGTNEGIGFAIPINDVMRIATELARTGTVKRPYLGVELAPNVPESVWATNRLTRRVGAQVSAVNPNSPASTSGLRVGDLILRFNDVEVENDEHLIRLIARTQVGTTATLVVVRDQTRYEIKPVLAAQVSN
ncbi:MAG: trypsin-like peptidase domain-containing protein [Planctomycetaceae bacterium]|nr:trypsin-like peptidase domain-containing protein [Planctomycetaceae bacterium]